MSRISSSISSHCSRTQSSNVQIIKIIQKEGSPWVRDHRNVTKVTLGEGLKKRHNSAVSSTKLNDINKTDDDLESMKESIMKMVEDKNTVMKENNTLKRYKQSVESLVRENHQLKQEILRLKRLSQGEDVNNNSDDEKKLNQISYNDLVAWLGHEKSSVCDHCNENVLNQTNMKNISDEPAASSDYLNKLTRELLILFLFSKLNS